MRLQGLIKLSNFILTSLENQFRFTLFVFLMTIFVNNLKSNICSWEKIRLSPRNSITLKICRIRIH
jgi:hypothetical protein